MTLRLSSEFECDTCHRKYIRSVMGMRIPDIGIPGGWIEYEKPVGGLEPRHRCDVCVSGEYEAAAAAMLEQKALEASEKIRNAMAENFSRWAEEHPEMLQEAPKPRRGARKKPGGSVVSSADGRSRGGDRAG